MLYEDAVVNGLKSEELKMGKPLSQMEPGENGVVCDVDAGHPSSRRLVELGFVKGERVEVRHVAPVSRDPMVIVVGELRLALRRDEASAVFVDGVQETKEAQS
jgi:Fe2+ transport system protein FeoA